MQAWHWVCSFREWHWVGYLYCSPALPAMAEGKGGSSAVNNSRGNNITYFIEEVHIDSDLRRCVPGCTDRPYQILDSKVCKCLNFFMSHGCIFTSMLQRENNAWGLQNRNITGQFYDLKAIAKYTVHTDLQCSPFLQFGKSTIGLMRSSINIKRNVEDCRDSDITVLGHEASMWWHYVK